MAEDGEDRSGDLYDSGMGDMRGGSVEFDRDDSGKDHHVAYGDGGHLSWDVDRDGNVSGVHDRIHGD